MFLPVPSANLELQRELTAYETRTKALEAQDFFALIRLNEEIVIGMAQSTNSKEAIIEIEGEHCETRFA